MKVEYGSDIGAFYGKIKSVSDLMNFECADLQDFEKDFHSAVDDFISFCDGVFNNAVE